jgi:hydrophobe/amphiphile efflux-1 (HAE1) family protein
MQYTVTLRGRLVDKTQFENIVVRTADDGSQIHLKDIARIELAATDYSRSTELSGTSSILISINQLPDANALDVARVVVRTMDQVAKRFPPGIEYSVPFDTTRFVDESIHELEITIGIAVVLVLLVIFIFLESWRATLIPMLAVPVAIIGTFSVFLALGFSINTLTLFAIVLAIGLVVDDAIVVVESVTEKMETHHLNPRDATRAAMEDVSGPIIAIGVVLVAVFVPVALLGGLTGQFYRQFAITMSISSLISLLVALTFTPALCALLLKPSEDIPSHGPLARFAAGFDRNFKRFTDHYSHTVQRAIRRSAITLAVFLAVVVATGWLAWDRPGGFIPDEDQGYLIAIAQLPPGTSLQRTRAVARQMQTAAGKMPEVSDVMAVSGLSFLTGTNNSYSATCFVILKPWADRSSAASHASEVMKRLNAEMERIAAANVLIVNPSAVPGIGQASGFEFIFEDQAGGDMAAFSSNLKQ